MGWKNMHSIKFNEKQKNSKPFWVCKDPPELFPSGDPWGYLTTLSFATKTISVEELGSSSSHEGLSIWNFKAGGIVYVWSGPFAIFIWIFNVSKLHILKMETQFSLNL